MDERTQEIWYVADYFADHSDAFKAIFCGSDAVLINQWDSLKLVNVYTGEPLSNVPRFEYGQSDRWEDEPKYYTVGIAYDWEQKKILIAYHNSYDEGDDWALISKIYVAVFNLDGEQINTIDTGFMMQPYVRSYANHVIFEVANGTAVISSPIMPTLDSPCEFVELGRIQY